MLRCLLGCCCCYGCRASVSERNQAEQDRFHLVNATHPAINAQPAEPLTGTYNNLSKRLGKPEVKYPGFCKVSNLTFQLIYVVTPSIHFASPCLSRLFYADRHGLEPVAATLQISKALRHPPNPATP